MVLTLLNNNTANKPQANGKFLYNSSAGNGIISPTQQGNGGLPVTFPETDFQTPLKNSASPYTYFNSQNSIPNQPGAASLGANLMQGYEKINYNPKSAQSYIPPELLAQLGQVTGGLSNYKPEKIDVGKVQNLPVEYYQSQIDDLSKPLSQQYDLARANARGDQAARGTIYDSQGYKDIGQLDKSYIDQLGAITRGVEQQRMQNEQQNQQAYIDRMLQEATGRRDLGLQGLNTAGGLLSNVFQSYGNLGQWESKLGVDTALQNKGLDANTINSLLGFGADTFKTKGDLFGNIYNSDTDFNKALIQDVTDRNIAKKQNIIDLLGLPGYTDQPQRLLWNDLVKKLGYNLSANPTNDNTQNDNSGPALPDPNSVAPGTQKTGPDGATYTSIRQNGSNYRRKN